jgi:hypothetical protein
MNYRTIPSSLDQSILAMEEEMNQDIPLTLSISSGPGEQIELRRGQGKPIVDMSEIEVEEESPLAIQNQ